MVLITAWWDSNMLLHLVINIRPQHENTEPSSVSTPEKSSTPSTLKRKARDSWASIKEILLFLTLISCSLHSILTWEPVCQSLSDAKPSWLIPQVSSPCCWKCKLSFLSIFANRERLKWFAIGKLGSPKSPAADQPPQSYLTSPNKAASLDTAIRSEGHGEGHLPLHHPCTSYTRGPESVASVVGKRQLDLAMAW